MPTAAAVPALACMCVLAGVALAAAHTDDCSFMHTASAVAGYNENCDRRADLAGFALVNTSSLARATARGVHRGLPPVTGRHVCASLCANTPHCAAFVYGTDRRCFLGTAETPPFHSSTCVGVRESWAYSACRAPRNASVYRLPSLRTVMCDNFCAR